MADYQGRLKVTLQGLDQIRQLDDYLESIEQRAENVRQAIAGVGAALKTNLGRRERALSGKLEARQEVFEAERSVRSVAQRRSAQGKFLQGPGPNARRIARQRLQAASIELENAGLELKQALEEKSYLVKVGRRLQGRTLPAYILRGDKARGKREAVLGRAAESASSINQAIRLGSFEAQYQRRLQAFRRGGGGTNAPELIEKVFQITQAYNVQKRIISATGDLSARVTRKQAAELSTLSASLGRYNEAQLESNRLARSRVERLSGARKLGDRLRPFEIASGTARDPGTGELLFPNVVRPPFPRRDVTRARGLVNRAAKAAESGDQELFRLASFQAQNIIKKLEAGVKAGLKNAPSSLIPQGPLQIASRVRALRENSAQLALPSSTLLAQRIARTPGGVAPTRLDELKKQEEKRLAEETKEAAKQVGRFAKKLEQEEKRLASLGIGVSMPERIGGPRRRVSAIPMGGGIDSGTMPRALPSSKMLERRVALSGQMQPTRLDELKKQEEKRLAEETKRAAGSVKRFADAVEREAKRQASLGIGVPERVGGSTGRSRAGAIPMGGQGGRPGMFDQYAFPAGPGNAMGAAEFRRQKAAQKAAKPAPGFFRGDARKAIGEGLIGGAFPLLFGQGVGASVGGLAGGLAGGAIGGSFGFGLSLVGTAVGQAVDTTAQNLKDLAGALKSPNDTMAALEASGYRVSDSLKFQVEQLQSVGRAYDAQTLVLQEVQKRLGPGSLTELTELDTAQKPLQESWAAIGAEIQVRLLPVLQGFVEFLGSAAGDIGGFASQSRLQRLDPAKLEELRTQAIRETAKGPFGSFGDKAAFDTRLNELTRQELSRRFAGERAQVPRSPQEAFADETTRIQESRRIADQIQSAYREAFQLQRQAYDLQRDGADLNKEIADYSYKKQREIFDLRQQVAEKEIENNRAAAQNRIERGDLSARQTFAAATGFEQQLLTNVRESMRTRKEGEADIEQSRRRLELTMAKLNRDVEDYKRTNAREIEDIERRKLSYVRSVEDYKMRVADYVLQRSRESADFMRQAMAQGEVSSAGGGGAATGYFARLAELESTSGKNWQNPSSNARGFFQLIPKTENWLNSIGKSDLAARMLSRDFNTASQAAKEFAILMRPAAKGLIEAGDVAGLDRLLNRIWTSLPGGAEAATGQRLARANALLTPQAGMAAGRYIQGGWGPRGPNQYGAHFDIARSDASYFERNALDRYVRVNGAPLSSGYTVPGPTGGRFGASRDGGTREHRAWDYAFGAGAALTLTGGAQWVSSNRGDYGDRTAFMTPDGKVYRIIHGKFEGSVGNAPQAMAAGRISNIPVPQFNPVPIGPTPAAAPLNAAREMLGLSQGRGLQDAQRMLEEQNKLKQDGIELGQIEQILQSTQLPQLKQQGDALRRQIEARQQNLTLSDEAAAIADIQAEGEARLAQLLEDRRNALQKVQTQYSGDVERIKQVNKQAAEAIAIAKGEEEQRIKNVKLSNQAQNFDRGRAEILQLQEGLTLAKVEAAALERGELQAGNVELFKASALYERLTEQQKQMAEGLVAQTEELRKQNEFRKQMNELQQDTRLAGAGLRAGMIGAPARAFEEGLKKFDGDVGRAAEFANQTKLFENQQLVWQNLEKNIVDVSDAISGALTNGLLDIVSGARKIEDVGREMLNGIARSFADSAQQQLTTLMQRQLAQLAGPKLAGMLGAGAEAAGPQALGMASLTAAGQVAMFGASLQTVMAQMALSGVGSGLGSAPSLLSSGIGSLIPGFAPSFTFGGFFANGGTTRPGEAYVVGDGGEPEFFFPGTTGRVVPKSDMEKAAALREQGESDQSVIDLRYTVTEQAGQRYVTEEQFRKGMADTSRRTQAITYAGIRNNKEVRDFVGV